MSDRLTNDDLDELCDLLEASFAHLARLHDKLINVAVEHYDRNNRSTDALEVVKATHASNKAAVVKAVMVLRFPEASDDWF